MQFALFSSSFGEKSKSPYAPVVAALQTSPEKLTWENVTARMLQEYEEKQNKKEDGGSVSGIGSKALMASNRGSDDGRKRTETRRCYNCDQRGYLAKKCHRKKKCGIAHFRFDSDLLA